MISDGEPTAHLEHGRSYFAYPPSPITIRETLKEVRRCTQKGIVINTFMLDRNYYLKEFVNQIAKMNKGRVFYTTPERLGQYILVDYVAQKRKRFGERRRPEPVPWMLRELRAAVSLTPAEPRPRRHRARRCCR